MIKSPPIPSSLMTPDLRAQDADRFWAKVDKAAGQGPVGDCWTWKPGLMKEGYPRAFSIRGKSYRPSHIAMASDGRLRPAAEFECLHSCDHPPCVNPSHLRWGSRKENQAEALERRKLNPKGSGLRGRPQFTDDEVREIRLSAEPNCDVARRYGVSNPCIHNIRSRRSYAHVA